ncbi:unnamed protein product [Gongylonema pulchrum]|uniref:Uncharacterized protein n=1 Tax=Gongylonema pulchrum TaxID=637853 RepID=A0A3P7NB78_9BILA|nr:unnamed protein product [Gongylonema pulchrum]
MEDSGMTEKDRKAVIEMVMDVSGAQHAVEMGLDVLGQTNFFGLEDKFFEVQIVTHFRVKEPREVNFDVDEYEKLDRHHRLDALWKNVERIAHSRSEDRNRTKRQISVLAPVILAPYMFSPIFGLSILGPVVLSPNIFSPLILNPSVLGPFILDPAIFIPFIISPYVLSPYILSPILGGPFVLSPYVLSPNM